MNLYFRSLLFLTLTLFASCESNEDARPNLVELLHGKYRFTEITADQDVDINGDGVYSTNILAEIPYIDEAYLVLLIKEKDNLLSLMWPEQSFVAGSSPEKPLTWYLLQSYPFYFDFNSQENKIAIDMNRLTAGDPSKFVVPDSIHLLPDNTMKVTFSKNINTRDGWKKLAITALYKRFTTST